MNENVEYDANYQDLQQGNNDIVKTVNSINDSINNANKIANELNSESSFSGPIADYCLNTWNNIQNITINDNSNLVSSAHTINNINTNYQVNDKETGESVGNV